MTPATEAGRGKPLTQVAALYVETGGCYFGLPGVEPWDESRDARSYSGPYPVVAHPPCQRWGAMANVNYARWGGEHNRPGNDGGCFAAALSAVRLWGGVLEHPAKSRAWAAHGLAAPVRGKWLAAACGGWVCEVWQSAYGHRANKATWLFVSGLDCPPEVDWSRPVATHQIGFHDQRGKDRNKPTLSKREANATPVAFMALLLAIARTARLPPGARRMKPSASDSHRLTAGACRFAADAWEAGGSDPQRSFVPTLRQWAVNADRRASANLVPDQPDLFPALYGMDEAND